ncbi:MAG: beta-propeller domain-containing protein [Myxococcota bacterium]
MGWKKRNGGWGNRLAYLVLGLAAFGCGGVGLPEVPESWKGKQTSFESAVPNSSQSQNGGADTGAPSAGETDSRDDGSGETRDIEEADIVRHVDNHLFILNAYRGLQILDVSNPDEPRLVSRVPIYGHPVEMYIRDGRAIVVVSDYFSYWRIIAEDGDDDVEGFHGSTLAIIDVSQPQSPILEKQLEIEGYVSETRRVGDVIYAVSNRYAWWSWYGSTDNIDRTYVLSVNLEDPDNIHAVDEVAFEGTSYQLTLTTDTLFITAPSYGDTGYQTDITLVDISDPAGDINVRGTARVPGYVQTKFHLDAFENHLRVVSMDWNTQSTHVSVVDVSNPDQPTLVGSTTLGQGDQLFATRFDGNRAYIVTYERVDPLYIVDFTVPSEPLVLGELTTPGWSNFIEPRGDRLITMGVDDTNNSWRAAVSLFDVSDPANPQLINRVPVGEGYSWSAANYDPKAFKVLDDLGLILLPFQTWGTDEAGRYQYSGGLQLFEFTRDSLTARGASEQTGYVQRALPIGERIYSVSDRTAFALDISDRDHPTKIAEVELARNIQDFAIVNNHGVMLVSDWYSGEASLRIAPLSTLDNVDDGVPVAQVALNDRAYFLLTNGNLVYALGYDWQDYHSVIQVVDLTDAANPVLRGRLELPYPIWYYGQGSLYYGYWWDYGGQLVQVGGDVLVFNRPRWWYWGDAGYQNSGDEGHFEIIDLRNPDAPVLAEPITVSRSFPQNPLAHGNELWFTTWEADGEVNGQPVGRYYLERIDLTDPSHPVHRPSVNVPGTFIGSGNTDDGTIIYTLDYRWIPEEDQNGSAYWWWGGALRLSLNALLLVQNTAFLGDTLELEGHAGSVSVENGVAYFTEQEWYWYEEDYADGVYNGPEWRLRAVDLRQPQDIRVGADLTQRGYGWLLGIGSGKLFFTSGWGGGVMVFDLADPATPTLETYARTQGYSWRVETRNNTAFLSAGMYGMQVLQLAADPL